MARCPSRVSLIFMFFRFGCPMELSVRTCQLITGELLNRAAANGERNYSCFTGRLWIWTTAIFTITTIITSRGTLEQTEDGLTRQTRRPFWRVIDDDFAGYVARFSYSCAPTRTRLAASNVSQKLRGTDRRQVHSAHSV